MITDEIREQLFRLQDTKYRDFQSKLIPTVDPETIIGVRTPALRKLAKQLASAEDIDVFLNALPHAYFDENQLHAFVISEMKDYAQCLEAVDLFLPTIDNWATCDQMSPKVFRKHRQELLGSIRQWIASEETYPVRFAVGMLMEYFLDEDFDPAGTLLRAHAQRDRSLFRAVFDRVGDQVAQHLFHALYVRLDIVRSV